MKTFIRRILAALRANLIAAIVTAISSIAIAAYVWLGTEYLRVVSPYQFWDRMVLFATYNPPPADKFNIVVTQLAGDYDGKIGKQIVDDLAVSFGWGRSSSSIRIQRYPDLVRMNSLSRDEDRHAEMSNDALRIARASNGHAVVWGRVANEGKAVRLYVGLMFSGAHYFLGQFAMQDSGSLPSTAMESMHESLLSGLSETSASLHRSNGQLIDPKIGVFATLLMRATEAIDVKPQSGNPLPMEQLRLCAATLLLRHADDTAQSDLRNAAIDSLKALMDALQSKEHSPYVAILTTDIRSAIAAATRSATDRIAAMVAGDEALRAAVAANDYEVLLSALRSYLSIPSPDADKDLLRNDLVERASEVERLLKRAKSTFPDSPSSSAARDLVAVQRGVATFYIKLGRMQSKIEHLERSVHLLSSAKNNSDLNRDYRTSFEILLLLSTTQYDLANALADLETNYGAAEEMAEKGVLSAKEAERVMSKETHEYFRSLVACQQATGQSLVARLRGRWEAEKQAIDAFFRSYAIVSSESKVHFGRYACSEGDASHLARRVESLRLVIKH